MKQKLLFLIALFSISFAKIDAQCISFLNDSNVWVTSTMNSTICFRNPTIGAIGGDTLIMRIDSSSSLLHVDYWAIQDNYYGTNDTIYNIDTLVFVLPSDSIHVLNPSFFMFSAFLTSGHFTDGTLWSKLIQFPPIIEYDSLSGQFNFEMDDSVHNQYCLSDFIITPNTVYWYEGSSLLDSTSGTSFTPPYPGNYWAKAKVNYELWDIAYPDTVLHIRMSFPSDTQYINPVIYPVQCIQSVGTSIQKATNDSTSDGAVYLTINGGTAPFDFMWSNNTTQQDLVNVLPGMYSVQISSSDTVCPVYYLCANISTLDDSTTVIPDTVYTNTIDTCLGFTVVNHYVSGVITIGDTSTVIWVFVGANDVAIIPVEYYMISEGEHVAAITLYCAKGSDDFYYNIFVKDETTTSIEPHASDNNLILYPNPATSVVYLSAETDYTLYTITGKEVAKGFGNTINVSGITPGVYIVCTPLGNRKFRVE